MKIQMYILENDPVKETIEFNGVKIFIEWRKGEVREYPGSPYKNLMHYDYGYIPRTYTPDGMETDVCLYDRLGQSDWVGKLVQIDPKSGEFDELKFMLGFPDLEVAKESYIKTMGENWFGGISKISWEDFINTINQYR